MFIGYICHPPVLYDKINKTIKKMWQMSLGMSNLHWSLHRETVIYVRLTFRELKLLYPSVITSNPPEHFDKNVNFTLQKIRVTGLLLPWPEKMSLSLWCFSVLIHLNWSDWTGALDRQKRENLWMQPLFICQREDGTVLLPVCPAWTAVNIIVMWLLSHAANLHVVALL